MFKFVFLIPCVPVFPATSNGKEESLLLVPFFVEVLSISVTKKLVSSLHERNIRVVMDVVFNHQFTVEKGDASAIMKIRKKGELS